jgi:hypothetical protein
LRFELDDLTEIGNRGIVVLFGIVGKPAVVITPVRIRIQPDAFRVGPNRVVIIFLRVLPVAEFEVIVGCLLGENCHCSQRHKND